MFEHFIFFIIIGNGNVCFFTYQTVYSIVYRSILYRSDLSGTGNMRVPDNRAINIYINAIQISPQARYLPVSRKPW